METDAQVYWALQDTIVQSGELPLHTGTTRRTPQKKNPPDISLGDDPDKEWNVDLIVDHKHIGNTIFFDIQWETGETTHEPYINWKELEALDRYLELHGVKHWCELPKKAKALNKKM